MVPIIFISVPNGPGAWRGSAGGLPRALDGWGRPGTVGKSTSDVL